MCTRDTFHSIYRSKSECTIHRRHLRFYCLYLLFSKVVVRCKTSYTGLFSFLAIPLLMGDIMIEFMNMIDINGELLSLIKIEILLAVNIMITTAATTTATTAAPNNNNNNNNNNGGSGGGSGSG